ncbi:MAG: class I SAM-dependent methyltransferase [Cyanobacteriota bacterium]|nr:class I SAM-dependent methyltransferase [Cyanobacteriota bacterium]
MATPLRFLSYRYPWLYDGISRTAALTVGGERRFRGLALQNIVLTPTSVVLDLCCGGGQTTDFLIRSGAQVTGLDASPRAIERARHRVPHATFVEGWAEAMPLADGSFDLVHSSAALHEMEPDQRRRIFAEVWRVLKPGGQFVLVDFHRPQNPLFWPGLALFLWLFETHTAWGMLTVDLGQELASLGFVDQQGQLYAGGSLQVIQVAKPDRV